MAVGLSVLVASRGPVIGILLAFYFAISPLLIGMGFLGDARQAIPEVAVKRIGDLPPAAGDVHVALVTAVLVVVAWAAAALGLGAWRTAPARSSRRGRRAGGTLRACPWPFPRGWASRRRARSTPRSPWWSVSAC